MDDVMFTLTHVNLGASDTRRLLRFYQRLLGWTVETDEPGWGVLVPPGGGTGLAFQAEDGYVRRSGRPNRGTSR